MRDKLHVCNLKQTLNDNNNIRVGIWLNLKSKHTRSLGIFSIFKYHQLRYSSLNKRLIEIPLNSIVLIAAVLFLFSICIKKMRIIRVLMVRLFRASYAGFKIADRFLKTQISTNNIDERYSERRKRREKRINVFLVTQYSSEQNTFARIVVSRLTNLQLQ